MERDPVCGMNVDPEKAKAKVDHGEKSYYFCSAGCANFFPMPRRLPVRMEVKSQRRRNQPWVRCRFWVQRLWCLWSRIPSAE